jgi:hypothetical protein
VWGSVVVFVLNHLLGTRAAGFVCALGPMGGFGAANGSGRVLGRVQGS